MIKKLFRVYLQLEELSGDHFNRIFALEIACRHEDIEKKVNKLILEFNEFIKENNEDHEEVYNL